jgi:small subunit ribosomal protein S16
LLKIRLSRSGKKGQPSFRVLVQEHTSAVKGGRVVEEIGYYLPATNPKVFNVKKERVTYWMGVGAKPSPSLAVLLKKDGFSDMEKYLEPAKKKAKKKKAPAEEPAPSQAASTDAPVETPAQ